MIEHNRPSLGEVEAKAAADAINSGWVARGPQVRALEEELCMWLGLAPDCAAVVSSGTAALFLTLQALHANAALVALPAYTCSALRNAVGMAQAMPHYLDTALESPNADAHGINNSTCEIAIAAHMYGLPIDLRAVDSRIKLVDDAAQAMGASVAGRFAGTRGAAGIFSFYATKMMTTGGTGGAVVSNDPSLIEEIQDYLDFDCRRDERLRFNFQLGDVQAAIGRVQLARVPAFLARREEIYNAYAACGVNMLDSEHSETIQPARYRAVVRTDRQRELISALASAHVRAIVPTEEWELPSGEFPNATRLAHSTVSLPIYPSLGAADVARICEILKPFA